MTALAAADILAAERLALPTETLIQPVAGGWHIATPGAPGFRDGNVLHLEAAPTEPTGVHTMFATLGDAAATVEVDLTLAALRLDTLRPASGPPDEGFTIRPAVDPEDVRDVAAVMEHFRWPDAPDGYWPWRAEAFRGRDTGTSWLATLDGVPVATGGLFADDRLATVQDVVVVEAHRGRGIGAALVTAMVAAHRAVRPGTHVLLLAEERSPAQRFYERLGFGRAGAVHTLHGGAPTA